MSRLENTIKHVTGTRYIYQDSTDSSLKFDSDSAEYIQWLAELPAFSFVGKHGNFTARKEQVKAKGGSYWYAYRKLGKVQVKKYLGLTEKLTLTYLEDTAKSVEDALKARLGISADQQLPSASRLKPATGSDRSMLKRIEKLEQAIAERDRLIALQRTRIEELAREVDTLQTERFWWNSHSTLTAEQS